MFKSKFNILFEEIMSNLQKESGNAISNISHGILRENIQPTIDYFEQLILLPLGITQDSWTSEIGTTGKKDMSGDIDIAININEIAKKLNLETPITVFELIKNKLAENNCEINGGTGDKARLSFSFPIQGSQLGEYIQVDLFPTTSLNFAKFNRHAPAQGISKYKGATRSDFVGGLIKIITLAAVNDGFPDYIPSDFINKPFTTDYGSEYPGLIFSFGSITDNGLYKSSNSWVKERGVGPRTNSKSYKKELLYTEPQEMIDALFGPGKYTENDFDSFESIWNNVLFDPNFPYPDKRDQIIRHMYHVYTKTGKEVPTEILEYIGEYE